MENRATDIQTFASASLGQPGDFDVRLNRFLHERLRLVTAVLGAIVGAMLVAVVLLFDGPEFGLSPGQSDGTVIAFTTFLIGITALHFALRRLSPSTGVLTAVDGAITGGAVVMLLFVYILDYTAGPIMVPALIGLILVVRSVVVPSRTRTTAALSLPVAPLVLLIQLAHEVIYVYPGQELPETRFLAKDPRDRPRTAYLLREKLLACEDSGLWTGQDARDWWNGYRAGLPGPDTEASGSTIAT